MNKQKIKKALVLTIITIGFSSLSINYSYADIKTDVKNSVSKVRDTSSLPTISGKPQRGNFGNIISNIFNTNGEIQNIFVKALADLGTGEINYLMKWDGAKFIKGLLIDSSGNLNMQNNRITNVADPINDNDVVTKKYFVDNGVGFWMKDGATQNIKNKNTGTVKITGDFEVGGKLKTKFGGNQQLRFENGNEMNMYSNDSGDTASTLFLQYRGGDTNIGKGALLVTGNNGNVGIGTSSPSSKLEVNGDIKGKYIYSTNGKGQASSLFKYRDGDTYIGAGKDENGNRRSLNLYTFGGGNLANLRVYADTSYFGGNVGIGTSSPSEKLDVNGNARIRSRNLYFGTADQRIYGDNSSAYYIDSNHNTVTQMIFRDKQDTIYGRVYGDGNGLNFGLIDGDGNWAVKSVKDSYIELRDNNEVTFKAGQGGVSGNYGTVQTEGNGKAGREGYSINGRYVLMSADNNQVGIYNDVDNEWMTYGSRNGAYRLYFNGSNKIETRNDGAEIYGDLRANRFYDRNDTAYYVDPNGSSNLNTLRTQGNTTIDRDLYVGENGAGTTDQYFYDDNSNTWRGIRWNDGANRFELEENNGSYYKILRAGDSGDYIADNTIDSSEIQDNTLTYNDIADGTIRNQELANNAVNSVKVADNTLTASDLAANSVGNSELVDDISVNYVRGVNYLYGDYGTIFRSTDEWLRLNDGSSHTNGVYVSNMLRADGGLRVGDDEGFYRYAEDGISTLDDDFRARSFLYSSDRRLKKNIYTVKSALDKVNKLRGVEFNWKKSGKKDIGLIAQEVEKVFPDMVNTDKNTGMKSVKYGNLVSPIIEAIKELSNKYIENKEKINKLENKVKNLEERLERLEKMVK